MQNALSPALHPCSLQFGARLQSGNRDALNEVYQFWFDMAFLAAGILLFSIGSRLSKSGENVTDFPGDR